LDRGAAVFAAAEEKRHGLDRYLASLKSNMASLCREAEKPGTTIDALTDAITVLLRRENARAKEVLPIVDMIRASRRKFGKSKAGARHRFYLAWQREFAPIEESLISELEALRDARLRLEVRRADLINQGKEDGPVFASAGELLAALRSLRK
jgi:hypothetical protein